MKAFFQLTLDIPEDWVAVGNSEVINKKIEGGRKQVIFAKTQPLSTYLFSFVAGRWEVCTDKRQGRVVSLYHRETDPQKLKQLNLIFDQVVAWNMLELFYIMIRECF